jgi:hypothetical protein
LKERYGVNELISHFSLSQNLLSQSISFEELLSLSDLLTSAAQKLQYDSTKVVNLVTDIDPDAFPITGASDDAIKERFQFVQNLGLSVPPMTEERYQRMKRKRMDERFTQEEARREVCSLIFLSNASSDEARRRGPLRTQYRLSAP